MILLDFNLTFPVDYEFWLWFHSKWQSTDILGIIVTVLYYYF